MNIQQQTDLVSQLQKMEWLLRPSRNRKRPGLHAHPQQGRSQEFVEYREYRPDDDSKDLDWKMYARTDRHYVKLRDTHTPIQALLFLDTSASMNYRSDKSLPVKKELALTVAFALGYVLQSQGDAFALNVLGERGVNQPRYGRKALQAFIRQIIALEQQTWQSRGLADFVKFERQQGKETVNWNATSNSTPAQLEQIFMLSDCLSPVAELQNYLVFQRHLAKHCHLIQVLDPQEIHPQQTPIVAYNLENETQKRPIDLADWQQYQENMRQHQEQLKQSCAKHNIHMSTITTNNSWEQILQILFPLNRQKQPLR